MRGCTKVTRSPRKPADRRRVARHDYHLRKSGKGVGRTRKNENKQGVDEDVQGLGERRIDADGAIRASEVYEMSTGGKVRSISGRSAKEVEAPVVVSDKAWGRHRRQMARDPRRSDAETTLGPPHSSADVLLNPSRPDAKKGVQMVARWPDAVSKKLVGGGGWRIAPNAITVNLTFADPPSAKLAVSMPARLITKSWCLLLLPQLIQNPLQIRSPKRKDAVSFSLRYNAGTPTSKDNCHFNYLLGEGGARTVVERFEGSPSTKANRVRFPGGVASGISHARIVPDDAACRWVFSGISHSPALTLRRCSVLTLIGSQHPDISPLHFISPLRTCLLCGYTNNITMTPTRHRHKLQPTKDTSQNDNDRWPLCLRRGWRGIITLAPGEARQTGAACTWRTGPAGVRGGVPCTGCGSGCGRLTALCPNQPPGLPPRLSPNECDTATHAKCTIAATRKAFNWLAGQLACPPPTKANWLQYPTEFSHAGIVPDDAVGQRVFLGDLPFPLPLSFLSRYIGSQDLVSSLTWNSQRGLVSRGLEIGGCQGQRSHAPAHNRPIVRGRQPEGSGVAGGEVGRRGALITREQFAVQRAQRPCFNRTASA
ncbi:hypothetical protein PR048_029026 [Dryococelus australis]|uniref:Uncharacterized protein n=1 Tax=Dryococelus australis TaxID=614101 RepID=A0ABQ9GC74_9NEOP|nr:hypothetical protein PR048_029026 [Dryococelus australis]